MKVHCVVMNAEIALACAQTDLVQRNSRISSLKEITILRDGEQASGNAAPNRGKLPSEMSASLLCLPRSGIAQLTSHLVAIGHGNIACAARRLVTPLGNAAPAGVSIPLVPVRRGHPRTDGSSLDSLD